MRSKLVPEHVNQDVSGTHPPATAWPRQMRPSTGSCGLRARTVSSFDAGIVPAQSPHWSSVVKWWYRLGCRVPTDESGVRGREPPGEEITEQVISRDKG